MTLADLIREVQQRDGVSYTGLIQRAHTAGFPSLTKAAISKMLNRDLRIFPAPHTIFALAAALNVPPSVVVQAICHGFGIHIYEPVAPDGPTVFIVGEHTPARVARVRQTVAQRAGKHRQEPA